MTTLSLVFPIAQATAAVLVCWLVLVIERRLNRD